MISTIIFLVFLTLGLGVHLAKHEQPRNLTYNFWENFLKWVL